MSLTTLEIKPDRLLMDSNFDGYKLSLEEVRISRRELEISVNKTFLNASQYGLLHAKLFGLHNHLFSDPFGDISAVYFVNQHFNVQKTYVETLTNELVDPVTVFTIPKTREQVTGDYNVTLQFANAHLATLSDGMGTLYILACQDKKDDDKFDILFSGKVLSNEQQGFIISDALYNESLKELHVLLLHIQEDDVDRFVSIVHWLTFKETGSSENNTVWGQVALRQLKTKGEVQYLHLEKNCQHVYVVSENTVHFVLNSEHPVQPDSDETQKINQKAYLWSQNLEEVTIKISLPKDAQKSLIKVSSQQSKIDIAYNTECLLSGDLEGKIDSSLLSWSLGNDNVLEIVLTKNEAGIFWKELIIGDRRGEYVLDSCIIDQVNKRLQGFTADTEALPQSGTTFNSQQIEDCDFETDKSETFDRISGITNKTTHRIHLGSHQVLLSPHLTPELPPALGIRHDVDVCLWQPIFDGENFMCKHEGTLLAFGYVQASKTNRKFITCSSNLEYAVISESSAHIFIYKQKRPLLATELRHRATGRRVKNVAQQHVFSLPNQDILGMFAGNTHLFLLGKSFVIALSINEVNTE